MASAGEVHLEESTASLVRAGLMSSPRTLPPVLLYDSRGSRLFDAICTLDEYYVTRTERELLAQHAAEIAAHCPAGATVVELGSGSSEKTELLLEHLPAARAYVPVDVSETALQGAALRLSRRFPGLRVEPVEATYDEALERVLPSLHGPIVLVFLGSNLGNMSRGEALAFLSCARRGAGEDTVFLIGLDLVKPLDVLLRAYDDHQRVTAEFNLNLLHRINRELDADFFPSAFEHEVRWDAREQRIEMHLRSLVDQRVRLSALGLEIRFDAGETIHTESSHKYTAETASMIAHGAGWRPRQRWLDQRRWFSLNLWEVDR